MIIVEKQGLMAGFSPPKSTPQASIILPETVRTCHKSTIDHIQALKGFCIKKFVKVYARYESPISTCGCIGVIGKIVD